MGFMGLMNDMDQDEKIKVLARKISRLERKLGMEVNTEMSDILKNAVGHRCKIDGDDFFAEECTILEVDNEWIKLVLYKKKGDVTKIIRADSIESIEFV